MRNLPKEHLKCAQSGLIKRTKPSTLIVKNTYKIKQTIKYKFSYTPVCFIFNQKALLAYPNENIPGFNKSQLKEE